MTESLITLSIVGLLVGFIFSMPIAGPISILVTSNALKGNLKYCNLVTIGASFADFVYVFAAVFGLTNFYSVYQPYVPYVLLLGTVFLIYVGIKVARTHLDPEHMPQDEGPLAKKIEEQHRGGFLTRILISFLNPTLFISWLTSSFIVISAVTSMGFNTGGLETNVENSFKAMHKDKDSITENKTIKYLHLDSVKLAKRQITEEEIKKLPSYSPALLSATYAFFLALGSIVWFIYLAWLLARNRHRINVKVINRIIQSLGIILCISGVALGYKAIQMLAH